MSLRSVTKPLQLNVAELAFLRDCCTTTIYSDVQHGRINLQVIRAGKKIGFPASAVANQLGVSREEIWQRLDAHFGERTGLEAPAPVPGPTQRELDLRKLAEHRDAAEAERFAKFRSSQIELAKQSEEPCVPKSSTTN